ncbi:hypothetical protein FACS1894190_11540 [Spirochaetia bacterium]|nr:hypothetical protein FACS1894190_11540 [Spirochaetia bacterium]
MGGGGVDRAIHRAVGPQLLQECLKIIDKIGYCAVGNAVITKGCRLPAKYIIHTVGPVWHNGERDAAEECATLIIPYGAVVNRIDEKKRGLFSSWGSSRANSTTVLIPAGEHTLVSAYSNQIEGWSANKLTSVSVFSAGKMYMLSITRDEKKKIGSGFYIVNKATSFIRDMTDFIPFIRLFPIPNPDSVVYRINEIDQVVFNQYLADKNNSKSWFRSNFIMASCKRIVAINYMGIKLCIKADVSCSFEEKIDKIYNPRHSYFYYFLYWFLCSRYSHNKL